MKDKGKLRTPAAAPSAPWLPLALRLVVGAIFLFSGFQKASAPAEEFAAVVEAYYVLGPEWSLALAHVLPWLELVFGAYLMAGFWTRGSAALIGGMLSMFIYAMGQALYRGIPLENCGCFGSSLHLDPRLGIALDALWLGCALWLLRAGPGAWSADRWAEAASTERS